MERDIVRDIVPQGSIFGALLFNTFICDMLYFLEDFVIADYADDSTPYCVKWRIYCQ